MDDEGCAPTFVTDVQSYMENVNKDMDRPASQQGRQLMGPEQLGHLLADGGSGATITLVTAEDGTTQLVMSSLQHDLNEEEAEAERLAALQQDQDECLDEADIYAMDTSLQAVDTLSQQESDVNVNQCESTLTTCMDNAVMLNAGNSLQTVTIVPSEMHQGGDVSYVLIVSQPEDEDGSSKDEKNNINIDMSIYDFKEEKPMKSEENDDDFDEYGDGKDVQRRMLHSLPQRTQYGLQAQLMCNFCNYTTSKRYLLVRHMKMHSEDRPHKCNICDRGFKTVTSLQNHINTHTGLRPHRCKECAACFTTSGELVRHVRYRHTFERPHKCTECEYTSTELSKLKRHMRTHTGERPYQCPHCSYASTDTFKLKRHLRIHTGEKPYECDVCRARFSQSNSLKSHQLIHSGNKPVFQCELCPSTLGRRVDLKMHVQKLHTSEKPLECRKCHKLFPDRYTYKIHIKTHEGEKCYRCELCPYAALSQRHLQSHILTHTGEKPYACPHCDQSFRQRQLLRRHRNLYHTPNYVAPAPLEKAHECSECGRYFAHRGNLLRHMAMHDPNNPEYETITNLDEGEEEEEAVQYVHIVQGPNGQGGNLGNLGDTGGPIQLQLVTEDGQNTILLEMDDEEGAAELLQQHAQQLGGEVTTEIGEDGQQYIILKQEDYKPHNGPGRHDDRTIVHEAFGLGEEG